MSNPLERRLAAEAYLGITTEEIDRLRRIEEAARRVMDDLGFNPVEDGPEYHALHEALEEGPTP